MGFASRTVSIMRYRVKGEIEGSFWDAVHEGVEKGAFRPMESEGDVSGVGWVSLEDFTDTAFAGASYARGSYIGLSLRVDTVKVPARVLEMHLKQEAKKRLEETGQKKLSIRQVRDLKDQLRESLKQRVFPSVQVYDLIWDTSKGIVYYGTLGIKARERFEDHFKKCFGLTLIPVIPYLLAEEILVDKEDRQALEGLKPAMLVP